MTTQNDLCPGPTEVVLIDPPPLDRDALNALVGIKVKNLDLYQRAFTHKSALKRYRGLSGSYETLEFMGDSVLGFIVTKHLFDLYEVRQEGFLTKARTKMVRGATLCDIAEKLNLGPRILMDEKGIRNGWNTNPKILEDVFEALVGAVYLDLGVVHTKKFVFDSYDKVTTSLCDDNYKDQLMRWCQALKFPLPDYQVTTHSPNGTFFITAMINGQSAGCGFASTKKQAEQNAAQIVLKTDARFRGKEPPHAKFKCQKTARSDLL
jgi:ribonuclease-3